MRVLRMIIIASLLLFSRVGSATYKPPIILFDDYAGVCDTWATTWINDENTAGDMIHIIGGKT
jgi:hypothetical protein